jgi:biopolymer transport protein ExbD
MRIPNHHDAERHNDAAMTPMIDVVFLLLIFLLCASTGQIQESLLPTDLAAGAIESDPIEAPPKPFGEVWLYLRTGPGGRSEVQVNQGGEIYSDFDQLERQLKLLAAATTEIPVILDIEPKVPLGDMIRVYDASRAAGFESINFAIDRPETKTRSK